MITRYAFRCVGVISVLLGIAGRLSPRCILPKNYSWSGDFLSSDWGMECTGFADLMNIMVVAGVALLIISFTTLIKDKDG